MDFLKAEIAKRKAQADLKEAPAAKVARTEEPVPPPVAKSAAATVPTAAKLEPARVAEKALEEAGDKPEAFNISNEEAVRRLRQKGQPVRLFAETDRERRLRVRALELIEERGSAGGQNEFIKRLEKLDQTLELERVAGGRSSTPVNGRNSPRPGTPGTPGQSAGGEGEEPSAADRNATVDLSLLKTNPAKIYPQIYWALKNMLRAWEQAMDERPEQIKRSTQGKQAAAIQIESADYLKPLFKMIRKRNLEADVLPAVAEIAHSMQMRQYVKANDCYLRLSIGNAAWPIGVTMVGIHERSARERISNDEIAHALNDEVSRKWIQSMKRLLTFAQTAYPPFDHAQRMG